MNVLYYSFASESPKPVAVFRMLAIVVLRLLIVAITRLQAQVVLPIPEKKKKVEQIPMHQNAL